MTVGLTEGWHWRIWEASGWKWIKQAGWWLQVISVNFQTVLSSITSNSHRPICRRGGIVPVLLLNGQPFQRINWMHVTGKVSAAEAVPFRTHESSKTNKSSRPCSPSPFPAISPFLFPHAGVQRGGVLVWVMRKISGGDALEVGTVWQEKQSVWERGTETGSGMMKDWRWQTSVAWRFQTW